MDLNDIPGTVFLLISEGEPKYIGPAWSLQFELLFYVIFCFLYINVRVGASLFIAWAIFLLGHSFNLIELDLIFGLDNAHCFQFLCGVGVGWLARRYTFESSKSTLLWTLIIFISGVIFEVYGPLERHSEIGRIILGLCSATTLAALVGLENSHALKTPVWLSRLGSVSYSIYLGHILFVNITLMILLKIGIYHLLPEILVFGIAFGSAVFITTLIGLYVEMPIVNKLKHLYKKPQIILGSISSR